jgi:hypothetical protein
LWCDALDVSPETLLRQLRRLVSGRRLQLTFTHLYRLMGAACFVALFANVYKHGWHLVPILTGTTLTVLMLSLGVRPDQRTTGWAWRYILTTGFVIGLAAFRFLR